MGGWLNARLARANPILFTTVAGVAGFCAYFSMYAFRKPFTAATFEAVPGWTFVLDYKIALVLAQVAGYALSKLIGIKVVSELSPARRGRRDPAADRARLAGARRLRGHPRAVERGGAVL